MKTVWRIGIATLCIGFLYACASQTQKKSDHAQSAAAPTQAAGAADNKSALSNEDGLVKTEVIIDNASPVKQETNGLLARLSAAQQARIAQALYQSSQGNYDADSRRLVNQATPKMRSFIERLSCIKSYNDGGAAALQALAAPSASFKFFVPPMHGTKLHDKTKCLSVVSVMIKHVKNPLKPSASSWTDALQIKVSLIADDSGETSTSNHEINKNTRGVWWFSR
ncbi:MAG TPA: hypothetical protein PKC80_01410 [Burkholderiaceae bacterium]|nr:hypothetical protein [Burkholderiaceae bacterium]